jgi:uncharacterized protein (TIGR01777 family)
LKRILIAGASGLIGRHLARALAARGDDVVLFSRESRTVAGFTTEAWNPLAGPIPASALDGSDAIVNLAGAPIGQGRWTAARRQRIVESRETVTRRCVEALGQHGPQVLVNASAIGYYGDTNAPVDESAPPGADFLAGVCVRWEDAARRGEDVGRVVRVRTGIVLAREGGVLPRLLRVTRLGASGPLGSGRQWLSWIHIDDEVAVLLACIDDEALDGPLNAVAPVPVRQREFASTLARLVHRPSVVAAPASVIRLVLGEMADLLLVGQQVVPAVLIARGTEWRFSTLEPALMSLLETKQPLSQG